MVKASMMSLPILMLGKSPTVVCAQRVAAPWKAACTRPCESSPDWGVVVDLLTMGGWGGVYAYGSVRAKDIDVDKGNAWALYNLCVMYLFGFSVVKDSERGLVLVKKARDQYFEYAVDLLRQIHDGESAPTAPSPQQF